MKSSASPTKPEIDDLQHQVSQQRKILETYKAENKALKDEIEARTKVIATEFQHARARVLPVTHKCLKPQQEQYVPTTLQQEQLGQLTDLLDVFKRKVQTHCQLYLITSRCV